jgi:hypothetical protein
LISSTISLPRASASGFYISRECLATVVDTSISGVRVARELDRIAEMRGYPCMVVSDNVLCRENLAA